MKHHSLQSVSSSCSNKAYTGWLKQQNVFLIAVWAGNSKTKVPADSVYGEGSIQRSSHCFLTWYKKRVREFFGIPLIRAIIPFISIPHLISSQSSPPNIITLGVIILQKQTFRMTIAGIADHYLLLSYDDTLSRK